MKPYLAHYNVQTGAGQTVLEHLQETAQLAQSFADVFGAGSLGYRCGALHDIGKSSAAFQKRLLEKGPKVDHSTAGALEAVKQGDCITAFCVAGHHGGLPDGGSKYADCATDSTLWAKCKRRPGKEIPNYDRDTIPPFPPTVLPEEMEQLSDSFSVSFLIRMLFSCLVDADFWDKERFLLNHAVQRGGCSSISTLNKLLRQYIAGWWKSERPINQLRCEILRVCIDGGEQDPRLFTLTAPTGSGKTISSLAFALNHAAVHGKDRIIYVIPYVSIIEQTAQKFAEIFGEGQVVAHYTAADPDSTDDDVTPAMQRNRLATENWDAPIIVTTFDADQ